jgi:hypothetical protein
MKDLTTKAIEAAARALCVQSGDDPDKLTYAHAMQCTGHDREPKLVASTLPPFKVGDRVTHTGRQECGTVTGVEDGCVVVEFDNPTSRGYKSIGKYDAAWFRMYPRGLLAAASDGEERR